MRMRGMGRVYQPTYKDKATKEKRQSSIWWIQYCYRGVVKRESASSTKRRDAVKLLKRRLGEIGKGRLIGPDAEKTTFEELSQMFLADYRANARESLNRAEDSVGHLKEFFGLSCAMDITADRITAYTTSRQEAAAANATINRELSALKRMFSLGERAGKVLQRPYIGMLQENNIRKGFFEEEQFKAVLKHLPGDLKAPVEVAYITGWRIHDELLTRQKHHVDLVHGWLRLEPGETKNGEGRMFPLTPRLRAVLEPQLERTRALEKATGQIIPWLFHREGKPIKTFRRSWLTACAASGLGKRITDPSGKLVKVIAYRIPHDFRRTAVRNLERAGVSRSDAMKMVGHKTEAIYRRYAIADETSLREAGEKLAAFHKEQQGKAPTKAASEF